MKGYNDADSRYDIHLSTHQNNVRIFLMEIIARDWQRGGCELCGRQMKIPSHHNFQNTAIADKRTAIILAQYNVHSRITCFIVTK